jgi:hypothetical protein
MTTPARDDFFTLIHKALRAALFDSAHEAGRIDWTNKTEVEAFQEKWNRTAQLLRSHARHEDNHIWPLLESKRPGAVVELGIAHDTVEAHVDLVDAELKAALKAPNPTAGVGFYRVLNRFLAHSLEHFADEEPAVMELLWAFCTDGELAACRSAFMMDITPEERVWTLDYVLDASSDAEQSAVIGAMHDTMPPEVFSAWLEEMRHALSEDAFAKLTSHVPDSAKTA